MSFTYPIWLPTTIGVKDIEFHLESAVSANHNPFDLSVETYDWLGRAWIVKGSFFLPTRDISAEYEAFFNKLQGKKGTFLMSLSGRETILGSLGSNTPQVDGGSQAGNVLNVKGLPTTTDSVFLAGDYFSLGSGSDTEFYSIVDNVDSDGSGEASMNIVPALRSSPSDSANLTVVSPKIHLRLIEASPFAISSPNKLGVQFTAKEVV